jgi:beta-lactamase class A
VPAPRRSAAARLLAVAALVAAVAAAALVAARPDGRPSSGAPRAGAELAPARPAVAAGAPARARRRPAVPGAHALGDARRFARARRGIVAFAVMGTSGTLRCHACARVFRSASTAKTLLLVAHLRATRGALARADAAALDRMIRVSDNAAADAIYARVGDAGLARVARRAGLRDFAPAGYWSETRTSARDQARLFARLPGSSRAGTGRSPGACCARSCPSSRGASRPRRARGAGGRCTRAGGAPARPAP